jgi:2-dehydro-3-deoxygluconokinase
MTGRVVTFGEVMLRLKSPGYERLLQSPMLEATFGGGEANVAMSLSLFGLAVSFISVLPKNPVADACVSWMRSGGVDISGIIRQGKRMGLYFYEAGANQRPSQVVYDRSHSAIMVAPPEVYNWDLIFEGASWFHVTGITPALSENTARAAIDAVKIAKIKGLTVSCDYNYRKNLWQYGKPAKEVMKDLVKFVDVGIANEEDCQYALGITLDGTDWEKDVEEGQLDINRYKELCEKVFEEYPNLKAQAITLRKSHSANYNGWAACLHIRNEFFISNQYEVTDIVDRVGSGDAFSAGLIYALSAGVHEKEALEFATAASCLKHSIPGDINFSTIEDVRALIFGSGSGRIRR